MRKQSLLFGTMLFAIVLLSSNCKRDEDIKKGTLKLQFELTNNGTPMQYNDIVSLNGVNEYTMEMLRFYLAHVIATSSSGDAMLKDVILADASTFGTNEGSYSFKITERGYTGLKFGVGLDAVQNASDPVTFAAEHPLSAAQSMYWSWASKYRFMRLDGRANQNGTIGQANDYLLAYHPGGDEFYVEKTFNRLFNIKDGQTETLTISIDVAAFYDGPGGKIDFATEPQTHTGVTDYEVSEKFVANFAAAITVK